MRGRGTGLYWRIGVPWLLLMLIVTVAIAVALRSQLAAEERERMVRLATAHAAFVEQASLPLSEKLAQDLRRVSNFDVHFRVGERIVPTPPDDVGAPRLRAVPADGDVHALDEQLEVVARPLARGDLLLVRRVADTVWDSRIVPVLIGAWSVGLLIAVLVLRGLVRPLRNLAAQLPRIEAAEPLQLPEAGRRDEIGDVARALVDTREGLQRERARRIEAEKLAVLGRMTASLAHQVHNPVAAIKMHAQLWRGDAADPGPADVVLAEAARIERMLNQWMYLTRPEPPARRSADLGLLLDEVLLANDGRCQHADVRVVHERRGDLVVTCDRDRIGHVLDNLIVNAVQAMPEGGELTVRALGVGDEVVFEFEDSGAGFSDEALRRFGEFFFSEKEGGMGIGLAVAREVVVAHGGELTAANHAAGGRVTVRLPRAQLRPDMTQNAEVAP
ncbi:MAG: ATP-binding protein [Planctomycetota bacterium]